MVSKVEPPPRKTVVSDPAAFGNQTNIDRRTCHRVVPLKVLALGVSRTGTSSLRQALIDLGYSDCYHYASIFNENPRDSEMWVQALQGKFEGGKPFQREDWDQLLGHCMAITDTPCACFYRELLSAYPEAKVILTVRDSPRQWWTSQMKTIMPFFDMFLMPSATWANWLWRKFLPAPTTADRMNAMLLQYYPMYSTLTRDWQNGTEEGIKWYEDYVEEIKTIVPKERLLVMNVKEGWKPLCEFLGEDAPAWDFPQANTIEQWNQNVGSMYKIFNFVVLLNAAKTVGSVVVGGAAIAGVYFWRARSTS